jgi:hypothetical protein
MIKKDVSPSRPVEPWRPSTIWSLIMVSGGVIYVGFAHLLAREVRMIVASAFIAIVMVGGLLSYLRHRARSR